MSSIYPTLMPHHVELAKNSATEAEKGVFKTAPFDPRFPNQNLTRYCYQSYIDFQKCKQYKGEEFEACQYFKGVIKSICPKAWLEKWDTQVEEGVFVGNL
ncbi:uncharacterized protein [Halyomorpha halys]|uniref:uncharacterized protein n=1 Tax=Halyomorpha halys TaxID=286706 RepID=UPI0006D4CB0E|nr:cytochrome c oxidase subunit 6B-like [Halyomorpha halys]